MAEKSGSRKRKRDVEVDEEEEEADEATEDEEEEAPEDADDEEEGASTKRRGSSNRGPQPPRISVTLPNRIRRKIRIAAAKHDMEVADWCRTVIVTAAQKTMEKYDMD